MMQVIKTNSEKMEFLSLSKLLYYAILSNQAYLNQKQILDRL